MLCNNETNEHVEHGLAIIKVLDCLSWNVLLECEEIDGAAQAGPCQVGSVMMTY